MIRWLVNILMDPLRVKKVGLSVIGNHATKKNVMISKEKQPGGDAMVFEMTTYEIDQISKIIYEDTGVPIHRLRHNEGRTSWNFNNHSVELVDWEVTENTIKKEWKVELSGCGRYGGVTGNESKYIIETTVPKMRGNFNV